MAVGVHIFGRADSETILELTEVVYMLGSPDGIGELMTEHEQGRLVTIV